MEGIQVILQKINRDFSIYKVNEIPEGILNNEFTFVSRTDNELSIISERSLMPSDALIVENGWKCFRIAEDASFEKYGMIAFLADIIAAQKTSTLVVGTYDTDYLFIKEEKYDQVIKALTDKGCQFI
jgi:hypothetical protein